MNRSTIARMALVAGLSTFASFANAAIIVSEVAPWSSGNSTLASDWFELTNTGSSAVSLTGWKMDDDSASFSSSVALSGISSIAPGESVIFIETASSKAAQFKTLWFGPNAPANLQIGQYSGSGIGLSTGGDQVNIFNSSGVLQAKVIFGASDSVAPFQTFDNRAGINNGTISLLSQVGVNGAFAAAASSVGEVGSPGLVPAPSALALLGAAGLVGRRSRKA
jgi:hypothetical protein